MTQRPSNPNILRLQPFEDRKNTVIAAKNWASQSFEIFRRQNPQKFAIEEVITQPRDSQTEASVPAQVVVASEVTTSPVNQVTTRTSFESPLTEVPMNQASDVQVPLHEEEARLLQQQRMIDDARALERIARGQN